MYVKFAFGEKKKICTSYRIYNNVDVHTCSISVQEIPISMASVKDTLRGSERFIRELACAWTSPLVS